ncbi:MFS transporter [Staphylococcus sp. SQ8-PEA]|uniref:MFS transporter n=1 Tax=Staphylococcus marylandisciuri TaxID=2981529 RepID=A0ABT2QPU5_9STAP|nr:MFS transporter [Staphylococcus marylandisciuri]MCU5746006.1 MFS transporter [Staphylococcus marylandisciuri]
MQSSSSNNTTISKNFVLMLLILFLMEFARGMYVLGYLSMLPTATKVAVGITSLAVSVHFIADAVTNFIIGFILKRLGTKIVLTLGFFLAFGSLFLVIWFPTQPFVLILSAVLLGVAVSPIWVIMLASVDDRARGKQMGYVYFAWLLGLLVGWIGMNLVFKFSPTKFAFLMALVVLIAWVMYYFVRIRLTNYDTRPVKAQLVQIVDVMKRHLVLFPGILLQGTAISALLPILPTYAQKTVGVSTVEYTLTLIIGGIGCTISMLFLSKVIDRNSKQFMYSIVFGGFVLYMILIFALTFITNVYIVWLLALIIGLMYGVLLPAWNTFMASHINPKEQEETWGVFNSVQGFGAMLGPLPGGLIAQFTGSEINTFYFSAAVYLFLAVFYGIYFMKHRRD